MASVAGSAETSESGSLPPYAHAGIYSSVTVKTAIGSEIHHQGLLVVEYPSQALNQRTIESIGWIEKPRLLHNGNAS